MLEVKEVSAWLDSLEGLVTIQQMKGGQWFVSISRGKASASAVRPTFTAAMDAAIQQINHGQR